MSEFMCVGKKDRGPHIPQTYENNCPYCHIKELERGYDPRWADKVQIANAGKNAALEENKGLIAAIKKLQKQLDAAREEVDKFVVEGGVSHKGVEHPTFCGCGECFNCLLECFVDQLQELLGEDK